MIETYKILYSKINVNMLHYRHVPFESLNNVSYSLFTIIWLCLVIVKRE